MGRMHRLQSGRRTWGSAFPSLERDLDGMLTTSLLDGIMGSLTFKYKTVSRHISGSFLDDGYSSC